MSQVKIYGLRDSLYPVRDQFSKVLHSCIVDAFQYPETKRFHRFIYLDKEDFVFPDGRSDKYTIIEISLFEGRSMESKKQLYQFIFTRMEQELNISPADIEVTLTETPAHNWAIRGKSGDELVLDYKIAV